MKEGTRRSPSDHIKNLECYLLIAPLFVPKNSALHHFHINHPDLQHSNVIVSTSPDSNQLKIVGLLDWQHASILPAFLFAGRPGHLQNYDDLVSQALTPLPSLPANMDKLDQSEQSHAMSRLRQPSSNSLSLLQTRTLSEVRIVCGE